jgi:hypothetical protein
MLAGRLPERPMGYDSRVYDPATPTAFEQFVLPNSPDAPVWRYVSYPPYQNGNPFKLDVPTTDSSSAAFNLPVPKYMMAPTTVTVNGTVYPALQAYDARGMPVGGPTLAADADGDGVADSLYFRLPVSPLSGITYYATVRAIDAGSAINVNTARHGDGEATDNIVLRRSTGGGTLKQRLSFAGMFPASIALPNMITSNAGTGDFPNEFNRLEMQRYQGSYPKTGAPTPMNVTTVLDAPYSDDPTASPYSAKQRTDFVFLTPGDMLQHQLARRLDNPGSYNDSTRFGAGSRPFGIGDSMSLAYGFTLVNSMAYDSVIEGALNPSLLDLYNGAPPKFNLAPYAAGDYRLWFHRNFDYLPANDPPGAPSRPQPPLAPGQVNSDRDRQIPRAYLTAYNPVRNTVFRQYPTAVVNTSDPTKDQPEKYPTRANLNAAEFEELQLSFMDVMSTGAYQTPFDDDSAALVVDPYLGMHFEIDSYNIIEERHPARMFRSPLRASPGVTGAPKPSPALHPSQVLQLRAALAAANTLQLRSKDGDTAPVLGFPIKLTLPTTVDKSSGKFKDTYSAAVFGVKRQPFITEVYVNNNPEKQVPPKDADTVDEPNASDLQNKNGFAAIELYNPYDTPLELREWRLRFIDRDKFPTLVLRRPDDADFNNDPKTQENDLSKDPFISATIPPHGYMVIWNYKKSSSDDDSAQYLPPALKAKKGTAGNPDEPELIDDPSDGGVTVVYIKELHRMIGKEVVLMRPSTLGLLAPVDSFDCTGMEHKTFDMNTPQENADAWHYVRANDQQTHAWHFVYPGRYQANSPAGKPDKRDTPVGRRQQGTNYTQWNPNPAAATEDPWKLDDPDAKILMGREKRRQPAGHLAHSRDGQTPRPEVISTFPIQIANVDSEYQFKINGTGTDPNAFPLRGFARVGDVLQAPFIGSYLIVDSDVPPTASPASGWIKYVEVNAVSIDSAMAEDTDIRDDFLADAKGNFLYYMEDIGRFAPITAPNVDLGARKASGQLTNISPPNLEDTNAGSMIRNDKDGDWNDYDIVVLNPDQTPGAWKRQVRRIIKYTKGGKFEIDSDFDPPLDSSKASQYSYRLQRIRYGWAAKVLDYFTAINAPGNDFLPNRHKNDVNKTPDEVKNIGDPSRTINRVGLVAKQQTEDDVPSEGLININSANWKVLAQLPLVMRASDPTVVDPILSEQLAKRIVYYRDVDDGMGTYDTNGDYVPHPHGKFASLMELNAIPHFLDAENTIPFDTIRGAKLVDWGEFSTMSDDQYGDHVGFDFEKKYLNLTRISNLLTTRSDCFTVYLQVQGWRDAGTTNAKMVVQRRLAFIVDRSRLTATQRTPAVYNLPVPPSQ